MEPTIICVNNKNYYNADELKEFDISYFAKTNKTIRSIIKNKNIPEKEYKYFCFNKKENTWKESDKEKPSPKAKLFIKEKWSKENIPKFNDEIKNEYEEAPPILELKEEEKFKDINNKPLDIEVRGERDEEKCYFKAKDVSKYFEMNSLEETLKDKRNGYLYGEHYKIFIMKTPVTNRKSDSKKINIKQTTFLTYVGLVRLLFVSRNKNATKFQKWAIDILFTHQLGTQEQKKKLSNKLLGIPVKDAKETFKKSLSSISCVYLLSLNTVGKLRKTKTFTIPENIPDDAIVCKYGKSEDLKRRLGEHDNDYGKMKGVELSVLYYSYVDPELITDAENQLKNFFIANNMKLDCEDKNELVIINSDLIKNTKKMYEFISSSCSGSMKEIINKMRYLEQQNEINLLKHQNELKNKDFDCKNKDFELKEKNFEIQKLKTELQHQNEIIKLKEQIYNLKK